jgi:cytoskeletal protein RodZ
MESIGGKLKATREEKGYSLEQVARETHIAKRFLEAMEAEDFSVFPGEPYLLGFLRTYSSYLSLDPEEMVALYHNLKLQEQPAPIDELLDRRTRKSVPLGIVFAVIAVVAVAAVGVLFVTGVLSFDTGGERPTQPVTEPAPSGETITLVDEILERSFSVGDAILVPIRDETYPLVLAGVDGGLELETPTGGVELLPGDEKLIDIDQDEQEDIKVLLRSIQEQQTPARVVLRLDRVVQSPAGASDRSPIVVADERGQTEPVGSTNVASRVRRTAVIGEFTEREERFVELEFRGYSLLRYEVDGEGPVERYLQSGDNFRTSFRDAMTLGLSNAGSVRARVAGRDVDLGDPGEVAVWRIAWAPDGDEPYRLELVPMY